LHALIPPVELEPPTELDEETTAPPMPVELLEGADVLVASLVSSSLHAVQQRKNVSELETRVASGQRIAGFVIVAQPSHARKQSRLGRAQRREVDVDRLARAAQLFGELAVAAPRPA
jgi:hypothetical protein